METRHLAIIGRETNRLAGLVADVKAIRSPQLWTEDVTIAQDRPLTCVIIAENYTPKATWEQWWERAEETLETYRSLLPHLATPSTALLVAFVPGDDRRSRGKVGEALEHIIGTLEANASMTAAIDFTINAIEVPDTAPAGLIERRLLQFVRQRSTLASGVALEVEDLRHHSIVSALAEVAL